MNGKIFAFSMKHLDLGLSLEKHEQIILRYIKLKKAFSTFETILKADKMHRWQVS